MIEYLFLVLCAYLIGSIPTGFIIARYGGIKNITQHGSGNSGATNVARLIGFRFFPLVLLIDVLKSFFLLAFLKMIGYHVFFLIVIAIALLLGNGISCMLQGKGGKGVATSIGIILAFNPVLLYGTVAVWALIFLITQNVGVSSVAGLLSLPVIALCILPFDGMIFILSTIIAGWGVWRHKTNIKTFFLAHTIQD